VSLFATRLFTGAWAGWDLAGSITYATSPWDDDWHHVAVRITYAADSGSRLPEVALFVDGTSVAASTAITLPDLTAVVQATIGHAGGGAQWDGLIGDMVLVPFAAADAQIAGWAAMTQELPALPKLLATGDYHEEHDKGREVQGRVQSSAYQGHLAQAVAAWVAQSRITTFDIET